ncbi:MAG: hypothetical protein O3A02_01185 [bacterium]|nr:hypothetical protein [bacterium]
MTTLRTIGLAAALALAGIGHAQLLAEVLTTTAIQSQLFPMMSFPTSSLRAVGTGTAPLIDRVPDAGAWTDWEVYTATGLAAALEPGLLHQVETGLAIDGFFREGTTTRQVGAESHTQVVFADGARRALLYVARTDREIVWLVARSR